MFTVSRSSRATRNNYVSKLNGSCHAATVRGNDVIDDKKIEEASASEEYL